MEISKKDLLEETKISYGQLYRWKREGLIPEEWFEKRSSYTGQETYFPREEILKRIEMIQQLKDVYSLDELSKMLNPTHSSETFDEEALEQIKELDDQVVAGFMDSLQKDEFSYSEVILMVAYSKCVEEYTLDETTIKDLITYMTMNLQGLNSIDYTLLLIKVKEDYYMILVQDKNTQFLDKRIQVMKEISLQDISSAIKLKYQSTF
ncbi:DUF4004 family protein [Amedibacillus sp. YH-ame10]